MDVCGSGAELYASHVLEGLDTGWAGYYFKGVDNIVDGAPLWSTEGKAVRLGRWRCESDHTFRPGPGSHGLRYGARALGLDESLDTAGGSIEGPTTMLEVM
ncbi:hypothetical protein HPB52_007852 [Rhipicephalus sanguineus]|uniref:Uncharacterized protein n=1 Tax=Rhipicephalus sanguineus TaxID=34632 RepID=A0A9D4SS03_RHISA|nr:hypothetical protein HPB52_007852 [Rhipicephalus sanguineus]